MTLAIRPTFSESWYRVAKLRVRLRPTAQISRQFYRGERWYVVRDPAGNQFHRLSDAAYAFVGLLDGSRTVEEAWEICGGQLADDSPTQPEVIQILTQLYSANLIEADITPDATVLLRRHKQMSQRKMQNRLMNVLFPRIPLWNPDRFLCRWMPLGEKIMSKLGTIVWLIVVIAALVSISPFWSDLKTSASETIDFQRHPGNYLWMWLTFCVIKLIHELGHAFACRRFGGEVHELGIMFLIFIPTPYVDASSAWAFPNRWARMFVGAAGMIIELFVAALLAFVWLATKDAHGITSQLAYNAMLIASVSTVVFNANPLLRYDGYYMLADWLEIPNLRQRSTEYAMGLIKRHIFRVKSTQPLPPVKQRIWLLSYAILSTIYRTFVGLMIILIVIDQVPVLGVLMAIGGVITWVTVPAGKLIKYLTVEPELHRKRLRATVFVVAVAGALVIVLGLIRFPFAIDGTGVLEAAQHEVLRARTAGIVIEVKARDGEELQKGQVILICQNRELEASIKQLQARLAAVQARRGKSLVSDQAQRKIDDFEIASIKDQLKDAMDKQADLTICSPIKGRLIAPLIHQLPHKFMQRGEEVATVAQLDQLVIEAAVDQRDAQMAASLYPPQKPGETANAKAKKLHCRILLAGDLLNDVLTSDDIQEIPAAQDELRHPALGQAGGGEYAIDPRDPKGTKSRTTVFPYRVKLANPDSKYWPGQRAYVRIDLGKKPLIEQWGRRILQLIQLRMGNTKWI